VTSVDRVVMLDVMELILLEMVLTVLESVLIEEVRPVTAVLSVLTLPLIVLSVEVIPLSAVVIEPSEVMMLVICVELIELLPPVDVTLPLTSNEVSVQAVAADEPEPCDADIATA
jgi:hypothetical protein